MLFGGDDRPGTGTLAVLVLATTIGGAGLFGVYYVWGPRLQEICEGLNLSLSVMTIFALKITAWTQRFALIIGPVAVLGTLPLFALPRGKGVLIGTHCAVIQLLLAVFTLVAFLTPLLTTIPNVIPARKPAAAASGPSGSAGSLPESATVTGASAAPR